MNDIASKNPVRAALELMRPAQWIKNGFVYAAPLFAKELDDPLQFGLTTAAFAAFCLISSAVYVLNDLVDVEQDKLHPTKRNRPLAAGRIRAGAARRLFVLLFLVGLAVAYFLATPLTAVVVGSYALLNILYSFALKHMVILDVGFIAFSFILRILAGAAATDSALSFWIVLCTVNVALFLGFAKRRAELMTLKETANDHRRVLEHYSEGFLDQMISIVTTTTLVSYILYTIDDRTVENFGTRGLVLTVPFVMYGIFRYLYVSYHRSEGGSPTRVVLLDVPFLINNVCWGMACVLIIYFQEDLAGWFPLG